jgi:hypothetical protein
LATVELDSRYCGLDHHGLRFRANRQLHTCQRPAVARIKMNPFRTYVVNPSRSTFKV